MSINLFIPAAGYGTRLKPLTDFIPKPLLPLAGIPLMQRIIESVQSQLPIRQIGINTHYLPEKVQEWVNGLKNYSEIKLFHEPEILGTGGAIVNASPLFSSGTTLLVNGDVINDIDWQKLLEFHQQNKNMVTLAVQDREHERRVGCDTQGNLKCIDQSCWTPGIDHWFGYACAAIYEPEFLKYLPDGESHVVPFWVEASQKTGRVKVFNIGKETYWLDIGNPQSYSQAVIDCLKQESRFLAEPLKMPIHCELSGHIVVEKNCQLGENIKLENVILLPGAKIEAGSTVANSIVAGNEILPINWPGQSKNIPSVNKIGNGGSDRIYQRENGFVKLTYSAHEVNIERQIYLTDLLIQNQINVPKIFNHSPLKRELLLQDLGDATFRLWCHGKSVSELDSMVGKILSELEKFQFCGVEVTDKIFDYKVLRWETSYFLERFVQGVCHISGNFELLNEEFHRLAMAVDSLPKVLMHRDFQSENIMIQQNQPWFIDFQGAHFGPGIFDVISFLRDPYLNLPKEIQEKYTLLELNKFAQKYKMSIAEVRRYFIFCGLQRHMQALGAYGFLAKIRGKSSFLEHIPNALRYLEEEVKEVAGEFPQLHKLVKEIARRF